MRMKSRGFSLIAVILLMAGVLALGGLAFWQMPHPATPTTSTSGGSVATTTDAGGPDQGILPYNSGITGTVMLGPTCPVMSNPPDPQCADKGYQTLVAVFHASDPVHAYAFVKSAPDGTFKISLPPGDYVIGAGESNLPRCAQTNVTVGPTGYTSVVVSCDTGIR
jgi:hypothetical protein